VAGVACRRGRGVRVDARRLDVGGLVLVGLGLPATLFGLTMLAEPGATGPAVVGTLVVGVVALVGSVLRTRRARYPLTDLSLLRRRCSPRRASRPGSSAP
jgi:hypothetical protein